MSHWRCPYEAQFFGDHYEFCCKVADVNGRNVTVANLDGDYLSASKEVLDSDNARAESCAEKDAAMV
ncbi:unnamed protein product [Brassica rapa subsp. narinosa]|uniref:(rape) hypothetical protein n=1 Tax=Brassica napus TaxID=3708 RepID=A0A816YG67_BRANA|nr:unnamed protein product [Brassica napus]